MTSGNDVVAERREAETATPLFSQVLLSISNRRYSGNAGSSSSIS